MTNIIVFMSDETHAKVATIKEEDSEEVEKFKLFFLACLHRQSVDSDFMRTMISWLKTLKEDDIKPGKRIQ